MLETVFPVWIAAFFHAFTPMDSGRFVHELEGLQVQGRVLYVAAHPDDENTHLLAWLVHDRRVDAGYLSLTRGDGGQNLIGTEQSDLLGVIRSWELLAARTQDGARQFIGTRRDFGFSKSSEETLRIWGDDESLCDVVEVIRRFRPHVVITRFPERGNTHGHHLASAQLARRAFAAAADPEVCPASAERDGVWQVRRLYHNVSTWNRDPDDRDDAWLRVDIGGYVEATGIGHGEAASLSRSRHRSQGFGWAARRGPAWEDLEHWEGDRPEGSDPFEGIPWHLADLAGGTAASAALSAAITAVRREGVTGALPSLLAFRDTLEGLEPEASGSLRARFDALLLGALGIYVDARSSVPLAVPGQAIEVEVQIVPRHTDAARWRSVRIGDVMGHTPEGPLAKNEVQRVTVAVTAPLDLSEDSLLGWLASPGDAGGFVSGETMRRGDPIGHSALAAVVEIELEGRTLALRIPVRHVRTDPVRGEVVRPLQLVPSVAVQGVAASTPLVGGRGRVTLALQAFEDVDAAEVTLGAPRGWAVTPGVVRVSLAAGARAEVAFDVEAPSGASPTSLTPVVTVAGTSTSARVDTMAYEHLPELAVVRPAAVHVMPVDLAAWEGVVGWIDGPGDLVADSLRAGGLRVEALPVRAGGLPPLDAFRAIVVGVRAFNARPELHAELPRLLAWVERGGVLVVQYQTHSRIAPLTGPIGPGRIELDRGRVTDEAAPVTLRVPEHPVFTTPHAITDADFAGWVQERGLYFAESWDETWTSLLSMADPGEDAQDGALLVAPYGEGMVVYTGLSFFRQLPAGVPGAWRLFVNLLSLGRTP